MRIVATSDCHGLLPDAALPRGDVLVLAGDVLPDGGVADQRAGLAAFDRFLAGLPFKHVVVVAGNHDWVFERDKSARELLPHAIYLEDESVTLDGVKFHGSPWQPWFCNWAFNLPRDGPELQAAWDQIPGDVDVLVTHGPPLGILDTVTSGANVGCRLLRERVRVVRPRVHIFGHIHESFGQHREDGTWFLNAALCDESYRAVHPPHVIDI